MGLKGVKVQVPEQVAYSLWFHRQKVTFMDNNEEINHFKETPHTKYMRVPR